MSRGRRAHALDRLDAATSEDPLVTYLVAGDRIEAAIRSGKRDRAADALSEFEVWATTARPASAQFRLSASGALLAGGDEATRHFEQALEAADTARPFDPARRRLAFGKHLRRERRRVDSRVHLRAAFEAFEQIRAAPWTERARSELRATGESARKRDPSTYDQLTHKEIQIARLVAEGMSNKEVAAQLFLSPRTIDYHLRKIFAKLGLTSRMQLAHVPLGSDEPIASSRA